MIRKAFISVIILIVNEGYSLPYPGAISGKVLDSQNQPLVGAQVWLDGYQVGATTDAEGRYYFEVPVSGEFRVIYQFMGFKSETLNVLVRHGERVIRDVKLTEVALKMPTVETREKRGVIHESKSPAPTVVIPKEIAEQAGKATIGEAATLETGVQLQRKCSACEASEISIQGLPGRYSLILMEGMPLFLGGAARYIIDMIPVDMVDRLEVVKGASGALWGSDAIAGAVNVRLLEPAKSFESKAAYTRRHNYGNDISVFFGSNLNPLAVSVIGARSDRQPVDRNLDQFAENTAYQRNVLVANAKFFPGVNWRFTTGGLWGSEQRRSGAIIPDSEYVINPNAEKVNVNRWNLWQQTSFTAAGRELALRTALSYYDEDGITEMEGYRRGQFNVFSEFTFGLPYLFSGISFYRQRMNDLRLLNDVYTEDGLAFWAVGRNIALPFLNFEHEILTALRFDINSLYGTFLSPYAALRMSPGLFDFDFAVGTGFRTPLIVFESIENLPGGYRYAIRLDTNITREQGFSVQTGIAKRLISSTRVFADLRLNVFYHRVSNFITAELIGKDSATKRALYYYRNLNDVVYSRGVELSHTMSLFNNIVANTGVYFLLPEMRDKRTLPFIRRWGVNQVLNYKINPWGVEINFSGEVNGPMLVQAVMKDDSIYEHDSPIYTVLNLRLTKEIKFLRIGVGVNNIFDYYQPPLHHDTETEYYWGPIIGRELYATILITI